MTPIFYMVLAIAVVIAVSLLVIIINHHRRQNKTERLLADFENVAAGFDLSIVKQQLLGNRAIGYDDLNNKLLYLVVTRSKQDGYLVDLEDVKSCMVITSYGPIKNREKLGTDIKMIALQLNYKNGAKPLHLPFYSKAADQVFETEERKKQAKEWQSLLSAGMTKKSKGVGKGKKYYGERLLTPENVF